MAIQVRLLTPSSWCAKAFVNLDTRLLEGRVAPADCVVVCNGDALGGPFRELQSLSFSKSHGMFAQTERGTKPFWVKFPVSCGRWLRECGPFFMVQADGPLWSWHGCVFSLGDAIRACGNIFVKLKEKV